MANSGSDDYMIDGKPLLSLRVIDLKQELKKRDIVFKTNATKAQLQSLIIEHLFPTNDTTEDKSIEENEGSEDTNETLEPNNETNSEPLAEDMTCKQISNNLSEEQTEATDLSQDTGITSSVSFGDKNSIKLTIKIGPNEPSKQLSPKKSPTKEMRSPVVSNQLDVEEVLKKDIDIDVDVNVEPKEQTIVSEETQQDIGEDLTTKPVTNKEVVEEVTQPTVVEEVSEPKVLEEPKQDIAEEVTEQTIEAKDLSLKTEDSNQLKDLSSSDSKDLSEKSEEIVSESQDISSEKQDLNESVKQDMTSKSSEELNEQTNETLVSVSKSEKESLDLTETSKEETKESEIDKPVIERLDQKREKSEEKKVIETEPKVEKAEKAKPPRRRRWGGSVSNEVQQNTRKGISSDQLKELMPDLDSTGPGVPNSCAAPKVSKTDSSNTNIVVTSDMSRTQTTVANNEIPTKRDIRVVRKSVSVPEEGQTNQTSAEEPIKPLQPNVEPKTKIVVEIEKRDKSEQQLEELRREVSPAKKSESNVVFIEHLVRPFTLLQLKEVLGRTGKLIEDHFWIDKIKSKCFATYDSVEEAVATRLALHGTRWPTSNPKLLSVEFATKDELDFHLKRDIVPNRDLIITKTEETVPNNKYDIIVKTEDQKSVLREKENRTENRPIREWDRDKLVRKEDDSRRLNVKKRAMSPMDRSRSQERETKRRRQDSTKGEERVRAADSTSEGPAVVVAPEPESPAKLLDDLFRKTSATPSIYWLPLTEEQAVARDALRVEEDKRRLEERNVREEQFRKRQEDRRPFETPAPFRNERNQWRTDSPPNRRTFGGRRGSPPYRRSPPGRRPSPPTRRRTPPPNRFSRSPVNRRKR